MLSYSVTKLQKEVIWICCCARYGSPI